MTAVVLAQAAPNEALEKFLGMLVNGLSLGAIYAVLAMGFVIIFKATQVVNFSHGALAGLGAFLVAAFAVTLNVPGRWIPGAPEWVQWALSALFAIAASALVGMALERVFIRPMIGEPLFSVAIITLGIDIVVRTITDDFIGTDIRPMGDPWGATVVDLGPVVIPQVTIVQFAVTIVLMAGIALFFRSRTGVAMRATAFDQEAAMAQGIWVGKIFGIAWAIGAGMAAVGGMFAAMFPRATGVSAATAFIAFRAFPAVIIGGLDSIVGAVVGGLLVGLA
ncbi:MAG TPA: branched-chain amino acid ABC transporter permease, partial [Acidimicrobiia bacterium]|nr:branched-chain amino acid ABC transporter permease [Acidimicrobiia bacterium]